MSAPRPLIAGNWKMNLTPDESAALARALREGLGPRDPRADIVVAPTFLGLPAVAQILAGSRIQVAGQNMHAEASGAFTGEVSAPMLRAAGAGWVILGHSERRQFFAETDAGVAVKAKVALGAGLLPILCLGETLAERESRQTLAVVSKQLEGIFSELTELEVDLISVAYEPVWAIGTGLTASGEQVQEVHAALRDGLAARWGRDKADSIRLLYGGSVNPENVSGLLGQEDVNGVLVGGASLKAESFLALLPPS